MPLQATQKHPEMCFNNPLLDFPAGIIKFNHYRAQFFHFQSLYCFCVSLKIRCIQKTSSSVILEAISPRTRFSGRSYFRENMVFTQVRYKVLSIASSVGFTEFQYVISPLHFTKVFAVDYKSCMWKLGGQTKNRPMCRLDNKPPSNGSQSMVSKFLGLSNMLSRHLRNTYLFFNKHVHIKLNFLNALKLKKKITTDCLQKQI